MAAYRKPTAYRSSAAYRAPPAAQNVDPTGFAAGDVGAATVWNYTQFVGPSGFTSLAFGSYASTRVYNKNQTVIPYSIAPGVTPNGAWVSLLVRRITAGLGDQALWGNTFVSSGIRTLDLAGRSILATSYGNAFVAYRVREIQPSWFIATLYGTTLVDRHHWVDPAGIPSAEAFGAAEAHFPRNYINLENKGIVGAVGMPLVENYTRYLKPSSGMPAPSLPEQFGFFGEVRLGTRYLTQLFEVTPYDGGVFGSPLYMWVHNKNRVIAPEQRLPSGAVGRPTVANNARIVKTLPFQDYSQWGATLVAYRIREIKVVGTDQTVWRRVANVYTTGQVVAPSGFAGTVGSPERVWNNRQWVRDARIYRPTEFGNPMVAFSVRTIVQYRYSSTEALGRPIVWFTKRYVEPSGITAKGFGRATLYEWLYKLAARSINPPSGQVGIANRVWNLTPELHMRGEAATQWGRAAVRNQFSTYAFQSFGPTETFGRHLVRDKRSWIAPRSLLSLVFGPHAEVRNVTPDAPAQQNIVATSWSSLAIGDATVRANSVYPTGDAFARFGAALVVYMGFSPRGIPPPYDPDTGSQFGIPNLPGAQTITPTDTFTREPWTQWGTASMWPHVIWAPRGYPYPTGEGERGQLMDFGTFGDDPNRPVFGRAEVTLRNRVIAPYGLDFQQFSITARVSTNPQYLLMQGPKFSKYGYPVLNGGGDVGPYGFDMAALGLPSLAIVDNGDRHAAPSGIPAPAFPAPMVDFYIRFVKPQGFVALTISPPAPPSWPRISTWVSNAYPPFLASGFDASAFGTAWVSHKIRTIYPQGEDTAIVADYTPGYFALRMRVKRNDYVRSVTLGSLAAFGAAAVSLGLRTLLAWSIRQDRIGAAIVRCINVIAPTGIDSIVFGDVQRWEAGKIKPHGDDLAAYGSAVINQCIHPDGWWDSALQATIPLGEFEAVGYDINRITHPFISATLVPTVRVGRPAYISGFDASGFGKPAAIAQWCGNKAVAVGEGQDSSAFGTATVSP